MSSENIRPNQLRTDALDGRLTFEQARNRIIGRDDAGLARLLILANGLDFVMKVSQDGKDALTASDDELVFNSNNNLFKIVDSGAIEVVKPANNDFGVNSLEHGLSSKPGILAYALTGSDISNQLPFLQVNSSGLVSERTTIFVDETDVTASIFIPNITGSAWGFEVTRQITYYLLQETSEIT